ncbi:hypothetical protein OIY81_570 [Cryptosporidium canis]|uniref:SAP domain-containing protein n=1 Tax=Cryptosporidium canis TaxID=195482 RepID=A0ABQ8P8M1_9CRYT|nr:hypothetical protein OJ252_1217 [Cryptosporidium canis]KAJ1614266.1 hypothetical protein OIY81_570 [Cryptosporidium canis]
MNYSALKIDELKELLKERGLSVTGRKQQLVQALVDYDSERGQSGDSVASTDGAVSMQTEQKSEESSGDADSEMKVEGEEQDSGEASPEKQAKCMSDISLLSEQERIALRRQRFGICEALTEADKRAARSKRFGTASEDEKRRLRQARFAVTSEADKIKSRRERFGVSGLNDPDLEKKINARKLRFGLK